MIIYHGSKQIIEKPLAKGSDPHNDYGPSFYLTTDLRAAMDWACKNNELGFVNKYSIRNKVYKEFKVLDLTNKDKYSVLNWIAILMHFRKLDSSFVKINKEALDFIGKYYINVDEYDVVVGFRADDAYFRFPKEFISGNLSYEDLKKVYLLGNLGIQYAFMSEKAISSLKFVSIIECDKSFIGSHYENVINATKEFDIILEQPKSSNKTYILDLLRSNNDKH